MTVPASAVVATTPLNPLSGDEERVFAELTAALAPRIQVVSLLGRGGMALVFLGRDPLLKRSIAIKVLAPSYAGSEVARARFTREAQAAANMSHPNVVAVYDVGELPSGTPYFLMQFVDGVSLGHVVESEGMFSEVRARRLVGEVASALAAAHARGLVHRDVKPANVIVENETKRAIVVDFGISAALDKDHFGPGSGTLTALGTYVGTPRYTSPEQAASEKVSGKSDVYSLGVLAFEVLTGRAPFEGSNPMALLAAHIKEAPPPIRTLRPDLDASFAALLDSCLAKDPEARPEASEIASFLVPEPQPAIEWPPPGLEELRGLGARTASAFNVLGALITLFIVTLAVQPTRGTAAWQQFESSIVWSFVANLGTGSSTESTPDATPMWTFLLGIYFLGAFISLLVLVARASGLWMRVRVGRQQGYPRPVLVAVAADDHADTTHLLNRAGSFAMLTPEQQRVLLRARRSRVVVMPAAFLVTLALLVAWLFVPMSARYSVALLPWTDALLLTLPVVTGLLTLLYLLDVELRMRGRMPWARGAGFSARAEFVRDWLNRASDDAKVRSRAGALVAPAIMALLGAATLLGMIAVMSSVIISSRLVRSESRRFIGSTDVTIRYSRQEHQLDQSLRALLSPVRLVPGDSDAMRQLAIGIFSIEATPRRGYADTAAFQKHWNTRAAKRAIHHLRGDSSRIPPTGSDLGGIAAQLARGEALSDERLAGASVSPWRDAFRRFALTDAGSSPFFFPTAELLREYSEQRIQLTGWWRVPGLNASVAQFMAHQRAGRTREARAIAEEVTRVSIRFRSSPLAVEYRLGSFMAVVASQLFRELTRSSPDTSFTRKATDAINSAREVEQRRFTNENHLHNLWAIAGNLGPSSDVLSAIADRGLRPYERWWVMRSLVDSYCTNAREILFGVSPVRRAFIDSAAKLAPDIARSGEWRDISRSKLDRWIENPRQEYLHEMPGDADRRRTLTDLFGWLGFSDMHARMSYCAAWN